MDSKHCFGVRNCLKTDNNSLNFMKGQAGIEFLMTYGWAILIVVIVVGALITMNIFNPSTFFEDSEDSNAVKCYETITLNDTDDHCNTTCACDIVCLNLDNETIKRK